MTRKRKRRHSKRKAKKKPEVINMPVKELLQAMPDDRLMETLRHMIKAVQDSDIIAVACPHLVKHWYKGYYRYQTFHKRRFLDQISSDLMKLKKGKREHMKWLFTPKVVTVTRY
jgi:hypothetical protein